MIYPGRREENIVKKHFLPNDIRRILAFPMTVIPSGGLLLRLRSAVEFSEKSCFPAAACPLELSEKNTRFFYDRHVES